MSLSLSLRLLRLCVLLLRDPLVQAGVGCRRRGRSRCLLLHENLGGGFSPPAAHKIRRLGRKARSGIDRTPYKTDRKISFVSYHTRSISMNITRAEAWQLHKAVNTAKGDLCRHRDRNPTGGA